MRDDNPTINDPGQPLEALVHLIINEHLLGRFLHESLTIAKKPDTPTVHVFSGLLGKDGQVVLGGIIVACRKGKNVTHSSSHQC
jgi:hypothetical protein